MVLMVLAIIPIFVIAFTGTKNPDAAGYNAGFWSAAPIIAGIGVGIWAVLAKSPWGWFAYIWRFVIGSTVILFLATMGNGAGAALANSRITDAEKQHLVVTGTEARHSDLGFVVPLPSAGFQSDSQLERRTNEEFAQRGIARNSAAWVLREPQRKDVVMLIVTKGVGNSQEALRGMARGIKRGMGESAQVTEDTLEWTPSVHEYRFGAILQGVYLRTRCLSSPANAPASYVLCVQTVSTSPTGLDETRTGTRLAS
jgi:hypothetical protein